MWKDYSVGFIRNNRASSISIMVAAFISSLFLSFLCSMFYNVWVYEVEKIVLEEGDWQGRLTGVTDAGDLLTIENFANVEKAVVNEALSGEQGIVADIYFHNVRTVYKDMPMIAKRLGLDEKAVSCHTLLLSRYLIHDPQDETPPLLLTLYLVILSLVSLSLILIIHNSFAVSMNARVHQFGILSSIGATPVQIRICLMQEAAVLCALPILSGNIIGIVLSFAAKRGIEYIAAGMPGQLPIGFHYHPLVLILAVLLSVLTVLFSAWLPAGKLSRMTPLEAIRGTGVTGLRRKRHSPILSILFGTEGELAGNALKAQRKALRTSTLSLTLSFMGFTMMLCFFSLTDLNTKYTYFQRYQDVWDIMITIKDTKIEDFRQSGPAQALEGMAEVRDAVAYQKAEALIQVPKDAVSPELTALGGLAAVAGASVSESEGVWQVRAPVIVMDDAAFIRYCEDTGITPGLDGTIILNRIWDSINSVFRYRQYVPYIREDQETIVLQNSGNKDTEEIPVLGYTQVPPVLREEYADYSLVQFIPVSLWHYMKGKTGTAEADTNLRILAGKGVTLTELNLLEKQITQMLGRSYEIESENRIKARIRNDSIIDSYKLVMGAFCSLLAMIGIANVFSYTLGFMRQRRREFAQYMSVGMTPAGIRKMFYAEVLVIAGRPVLITLPLTYLFIVFTAKASYLNPAEVWPEVPAAAIAVFSLAIVSFVALAYYIGGKRVLRENLSDALRDDTMT